MALPITGGDQQPIGERILRRRRPPSGSCMPMQSRVRVRVRVQFSQSLLTCNDAQNWLADVVDSATNADMRSSGQAMSVRRSLGLVAFVVLAASGTGCSAHLDGQGDEETESAESDLVGCPANGAPLALTLMAPRASIEATRLAFNAAQPNGGSWRSVSAIALYRYDRCAPAPSLEDLEAVLPSDTQQNIDMLRGVASLDSEAGSPPRRSSAVRPEHRC